MILYYQGFCANTYLKNEWIISMNCTQLSGSVKKIMTEQGKLEEDGINGNMGMAISPIGYKTPEHKNEEQTTLVKAPSKNINNVGMAINNLLNRLPELDQCFHIHSKIGEGTFSNVYLGSIKGLQSQRQFAIKHLIPTSHPKRIQYELECLNKIGGSDNVVSCDMCLRNNDCVVFVMPYLEHQRFADYVQEMTVAETKLYMKNLFLALSRVHSFNIIHRDVKPSNFLYNREKKQFLLVDFGLAQQVEKTHLSKKPGLNIQKPSVTKRKREADDLENVEQPATKRKALQTVSNKVEKVVPSLRYAKEPLSVQQRKCQEAKASMTSLLRRQPLSSNPSNLMAVKNSYNSLKNAMSDSTKGNHLFGLKNSTLNSPQGNNFFSWKKPTPKSVEAKMLFKSPEKVCSVTKLKTPDHKVKPPEQLNVPSATQTFQRIVPQTTASVSAGTSFVRVQNSQVQVNGSSGVGEFCQPQAPAKCGCDGRPQICHLCLVRKPLNAPRAGTPGFRPPEVLLKSHQQTTAVDMWAAGVIMLCILSGCYPFFRSPDDLTALSEFIVSFGSAPIKNLARKLGRNVVCNQERKPMNLRILCERLRRRSVQGIKPEEGQERCPDCQCYDVGDLGCLCEDKTKIDLKDSYFPPSAYHLLGRLLEIDPGTRITAEAAMKHPFLM